jgi:hypothetical protein
MKYALLKNGKEEFSSNSWMELLMHIDFTRKRIGILDLFLRFNPYDLPDIKVQLLYQLVKGNYLERNLHLRKFKSRLRREINGKQIFKRFTR